MDKTAKDRMKRLRERQRNEKSAKEGVTARDVTVEGVTVEMVPASYIEGTRGRYEFLPERPRFLKLSDGQVLDRLNQPVVEKELKGMRACNESYSSIIRR